MEEGGERKIFQQFLFHLLFATFWIGEEHCNRDIMCKDLAKSSSHDHWLNGVYHVTPYAFSVADGYNSKYNALQRWNGDNKLASR